MRGTARLLTERLQLRRFREDDADAAFRNWMGDPEVTQFLSWDAHPDPSESRRVIAGWVDEYRNGTMDWCITLRRSDEPIGSITVVREHPEKGYCEIGYCLSQRYWDQGYMTDDMLTPAYLHWLYTAFTRATEKLMLVNWPATQNADAQ